MKQKIKNSYRILFSLVLLVSANAINAQDSVTIRKTTIDSVKVQKTTVVHDTVVKPVVVHDAVATKADDEHELYKGEFGLRYLPTFTSLAFRNVNGDVVQGTAIMSNGFGIMLGHNFSKFAGIQLEINYEQISQKYKDGELERQVHINYINVPLLLSFNTDKTMPVVFGVVVGPQFGINVGSSFSGNSTNNTDTVHAVLAVKQGDIGLAYGAGFGIALNKQRTIRLDLGFRGVYGLVNMKGTPAGDNAYNILVTGSRKSYGGYAGITFLF